MISAPFKGCWIFDTDRMYCSVDLFWHDQVSASHTDFDTIECNTIANLLQLLVRYMCVSMR